MGRVRKKEDQWMPARVYRGKSAFEWRPKDGGCVKLCPLDSTRAAVWRRYEEEVAARNSASTFSDLVERYFTSVYFQKELKPRTQRDYKSYWRRQVQSVFGKANPRKITRKHIVTYLNLRKNQMLERGQKFHQANREVAFISAVFSWAMLGELHDLPFNPCSKVPKLKEVSRDRYIEDWEYKLVYDECDPVIRGAMEVAYLCAARVQDVATLRLDCLLNEGIKIAQGKTGVVQVKKWTPRLRKSIRDAISAHTSRKIAALSPYVFNNNKGTCFTSDGLSSKWAAYRKAAERKHQEATGANHKFDFTFHDLKAKGISDFDGTESEKQQFSGHKTVAQVRTYDRKTKVVDIVNRDLD